MPDGKYVPNKTREQSVGRSPSGEKNRPPCQAWINGHCAAGSKCREWHISDCLWYAQGKCTAGRRCIFLHRSKAGVVMNASVVAPKQEPGPKKKAKKKAKAKAKAKGKASAGVAVDDNDEFGYALDGQPLE